MRRLTLLSSSCALLALLVVLPVAAQRAGPGRSSDAPAPAAAASGAPAALEDGVAVFFSPSGGALDALVAQINAAKKRLDVQAYLLTTRELAKPIADAHARGVRVRVLLDRGNAGDEYSSATFFANAGVPVWLDGEHKEAHNKVMLIDGRTIVTGSMNFTKAADESNAENLVLIDNKPKLFAAFQRNFDEHLKHARPYEKRN